MNMMKIGVVIKELRRLKGLRQADLASLAGLKQPNLSRIEHGLCVPRTQTMEHIAGGLGMTLQELLKRIEEATLEPTLQEKVEAVKKALAQRIAVNVHCKNVSDACLPEYWQGRIDEARTCRYDVEKALGLEPSELPVVEAPDPTKSKCDCCQNPATKILNKDTSKECASWFWGEYCDWCYQRVEEEMRKENNSNCPSCGNRLERPKRPGGYYYCQPCKKVVHRAFLEVGDIPKAPVSGRFPCDKPNQANEPKNEYPIQQVQEGPNPNP